jgi:hypothetical protein
VPEKTTKDLDSEIERTRTEIADLQKRIREMGTRRLATDARDKSGIRNDPRIMRIDLQIAKARDTIRNFPDHAASIQARIAALETERYRLLLMQEE